MTWLHCMSDAITANGVARRLALRREDITAYYETADPDKVAVRTRSGREFIVLMSFDDFSRRAQPLVDKS